MTSITPSLGSVYQFTFESDFESFNGVYKLVKLMTYDEYLEDGNNLLDDFFTPNGQDETALNEALPTIRASKIMKLVTPNDLEESKVVFAPLCYVKTVPDFNVKCYKEFGLIVSVGVIDEVDSLEYIRTNLIEQFSAALGIHTNPKFVTLGDVWLSESQYAEIKAQRDQDALATINYFSENKRLQQQLNKAHTKIQYYEELVKQLNDQITELTGTTGGL